MNGDFGGIPLAVLALAGAAAAVALALLLWRLSRVAAELELTARNLNRLAPRIEHFMDVVETEIAALHSVTARVDRITAGVENVSGRVVAAADNALTRFEGLTGHLRTVNAAAAGLAAGLAAFGRRRGNGTRNRGDGSDIQEAPRREARPPAGEEIGS